MYVVICWEVDFVLVVGQQQMIVCFDVMDKSWDCVNIDCIGLIVCQFYDNGDVCMVVFVG